METKPANVISAINKAERGYAYLGSIPLHLSYGDKTLKEDLEMKQQEINKLMETVESLKEQIKGLTSIATNLSISNERFNLLESDNKFVKTRLEELIIEVAALRSEVAGV